MFNVDKIQAQLFEKIIKAFLKRISPEIEKQVKVIIISLHKKALETPNPWDDVFTGLLIEIFDIELPKTNAGSSKPV